MKPYWYSVFLVLSIIVVIWADILPDKQQKSQNRQEQLFTEQSSGNQEEKAGGGEDLQESEEAANETVSELTTTAAESGTDEPETEDRQEETTVWPKLNGDFSGVLFIGDSRTVGLSEYGNLGEAEIFASSGMSVFNLFDQKIKLKGGEKMALEDNLSGSSYHTIFLMLGINELGYEFSSIVKKYEDTVLKLQKMQPSAEIVLEANLYVTSEKSSQSTIYNNERISTLNAEIKKIAESTGCYFIDVNEIFDDGNGNLAEEYSTDGSHVLGKYYSVWVEWIRGSER